MQEEGTALGGLTISGKNGKHPVGIHEEMWGK